MENKNFREQILRISGADVRKCMRCGKCSAACPSYDEMEYHPHQFVNMVNDCDHDHGKVEKLMESKSIYKCLTCFACVERCPRGVEPAKVIEAVRLEVIRQQGKNYMKPDDIPAKLDDDTPGQLLMTAMRKYTK